MFGCKRCSYEVINQDYCARCAKKVHIINCNMQQVLIERAVSLAMSDCINTKFSIHLVDCLRLEELVLREVRDCRTNPQDELILYIDGYLSTYVEGSFNQVIRMIKNGIPI